jgi:hypothetical protein
MGYRRRVRDTGKSAPSRAVIDRHNKHTRETYPEIVRRMAQRAVSRLVSNLLNGCAESVR